jgi:manganese efflux pump family protein
MEKLKTRWGINSNSQLVIIFMVFAVTGSSSVYVTKPILNYFGIVKENLNIFLYYFLKIILVFPVYQILLVFFGFISGQFKFFWNFEKKMLSRLGLGFLFKLF